MPCSDSAVAVCCSRARPTWEDVDLVVVVSTQILVVLFFFFVVVVTDAAAGRAIDSGMRRTRRGKGSSSACEGGRVRGPLAMPCSDSAVDLVVVVSTQILVVLFFFFVVVVTDAAAGRAIASSSYRLDLPRSASATPSWTS
jgi:hypothetical protein